MATLLVHGTLGEHASFDLKALAIDRRGTVCAKASSGVLNVVVLSTLVVAMHKGYACCDCLCKEDQNIFLSTLYLPPVTCRPIRIINQHCIRRG